MAQPPPYPPAASAQTAPPISLVTKVQLSIACKNLRDADLLSKSDPQVVVNVFADNQWMEVNNNSYDVSVYINLESL